MAEDRFRLQDFPFRDQGLRSAALTHRSAGNRHNERLEFLGDSLLNFVIAEALFARLPEADEGDLTRLRSHLVRGETLAELAAEMQLGADIELGPGELKSGGHRRASIQADAFEALLGAILRDGGFETAREIILRIYAERLEHLPPAASLKDAKTQLQEWLQARDGARPEYLVLEESGPQHRKLFRVRCRARDAEIEAVGSSRRQAEQSAARAMLERLGA